MQIPYVVIIQVHFLLQVQKAIRGFQAPPSYPANSDTSYVINSTQLRQPTSKVIDNRLAAVPPLKQESINKKELLMVEVGVIPTHIYEYSMLPYIPRNITHKLYKSILSVIHEWSNVLILCP